MVRYRGVADLDLLRHIGPVPWGGLLEAEGTLGSVPYGAVKAAARVRVEAFKFLQFGCTPLKFIGQAQGFEMEACLSGNR